MSIKSLFFSLFLYVSLVWVGAIYLHGGSVQRMRQFGLLWTAVGLSTLLTLILGARVFGWLRVLRARMKARPRPQAEKPAAAVHEDDAALAGALAEAQTALVHDPAYASQLSQAPFKGLPVYLLVGPEGSGKTSTFLNAGLEPQLLSGQVGGASVVAPTRLCNIWLARGSIFIELAGRLFTGDLSRWNQLLRVIRGDAGRAKKRYQFWRPAQEPLALHGVVAFCDAKAFAGSVNSERLVRDARQWQECLLAIGEVFGVEYPAYQVLTRTDTITFFDDYFHRLPEPETSQVFGCTLRRTATQPAAAADLPDVEVKRLSRSFNTVFHTLAERRITHLAHESDLSRRAAIYEFPREFKRIRPALVQFLNDAYRRHPLRPGPVLRGYFMTAVRETEAVPVDLGATRTDWSRTDIGAEATRLFRRDATQIVRPGEMRAKNGGGVGLTRRWLFTSDLFHNIVLRDEPARRVSRPDPRAAMRRRAAFAAVCVGCALAAGTWLWSWMNNRELLGGLAQVPPMGRGTSRTAPALSELRALDALRVQVARLSSYRRDGPPLSIRWGLYSGNSVVDAARNAYFRRFRELILNDVNGALVAGLDSLPAASSADAAYEPVYRALATHLMISSGACPVDAGLVASVLKQTASQAGLAAAAEEKALIERQVDFYASELQYGNPARVTENISARDDARSFLRRVKGVERLYGMIRADAEKNLGTPKKLADLAPNYTTVLKGPAEVSAAFTKAGWSFVERKSQENSGAVAGDVCVVGDSRGSTAGSAQDGDTAHAIQRMYIGDYVANWSKYVADFAVLPYNGAEDASRKLATLASHSSPLLALFAMTTEATAFPSDAGAEEGLTTKLQPLIKKVVPGLSKASKAADVVRADDSKPAVPSPADITQRFQPVHSVVPPGSDKWVVEKNNAYVDALSSLSQSMREIGRAGTPDAAVHQAAAQNYDKAMDAVRQLARAFKPVGVEGLDASVQRLLEEPIRLTNRFIVRDMEKAEAGKRNADLRTLCAQARRVLAGFPFSPRSRQDAALQDVNAIFAPGTGAIWKFQAAALADLVAKEGAEWKAKDPAKKPQVTQEMLLFLNRAQAVADVFYAGGTPTPHLTYTLRPELDKRFEGFSVVFQVDGKTAIWPPNLRQTFTWPGPADRERVAVAGIRNGPVSLGFASQDGVWAIFRVMMLNAQERPLGSTVVEWKYTRGGIEGGRDMAIEPAPVRMQFVDSPADVFNSKFYDGLQCPTRAVQ